MMHHHGHDHEKNVWYNAVNKPWVTVGGPESHHIAPSGHSAGGHKPGRGPGHGGGGPLQLHAKYGTEKRSKKNYSKVNWQRTLGKYTPNKNYTSYKTEYNRQLRAAVTHRDPAKRRAELQDAWKAMRTHGITQNKRGLNRQLATATSDKARAELKRRFREHRMNTGHVALPAITSPRRSQNAALARALQRGRKRGIPEARTRASVKASYASGGKTKAGLKKMMTKLYAAANEGAVSKYRMSLTKVLQKKFLTEFDTIVEKTAVAMKSTLLRHAGALAITPLAHKAVDVGVGACALVVPFLGGGIATAVLVPVLKQVAASGGAVFATRHIDSIVKDVVSFGEGSSFSAPKAIRGAVTGGISAAQAAVQVKKALSSLHGIDNQFAARLATGMSKAAKMIGADPCALGELFKKAVVKFANLQLEYYVGYQIDSAKMAKLLLRHGDTIKMFLHGQDASLEPLATGIIDYMDDAQRGAIWAKIKI